MKQEQGKICEDLCKDVYRQLEEIYREKDTQKLYALYQSSKECYIKCFGSNQMILCAHLLMHDDDDIKIIIDLGNESVKGFIDGHLICMKGLNEELAWWVIEFLMDYWDVLRRIQNFDVLRKDGNFDIIKLKG